VQGDESPPSLLLFHETFHRYSALSLVILGIIATKYYHTTTTSNKNNKATTNTQVVAALQVLALFHDLGCDVKEDADQSIMRACERLGTTAEVLRKDCQEEEDYTWLEVSCVTDCGIWCWEPVREGGLAV